MPPLSERDIAEIKRISQKKPVRNLAHNIRKDLDRETLGKMISAYLVLKANGHTDRDFANYVMTKETRRTLRLALAGARAAAPSFLTDSEFRSLVLKTWGEMRAAKKEREEEQRQKQRQLEKASKNVVKAGPMTVTMNAPQQTAVVSEEAHGPER
jgi:hypothetical protein